MTRLSQLLERKHWVARKPMPEDPVAVRREGDRICRRWPDVETEDIETDAETLALEMDQRRRDDDWQDFYWADATRAAGAFLGGSLWQEERFVGLLNFLFLQIGPDAHPAYLSAMFRKYLETFNPDSRLTRKLAEHLGRCWQKTGLPISQLVDRFAIFDIDAAPHRMIAQYMDEMPEPFRRLRAEGLEAPHGPGLMQLAHRYFVSALEPRIADGDSAAAEKMLEWLDPGSDWSPLQGPDAGKAIDALLLPWKERDPEEGLKKTIETRLINAYKDLRVQDAGVWSACSNDARWVILKWLAGATIRTFFDIVTEADKTHMWSDRKTLWIGLHEQSRITEAWFALSDFGSRIANRLGSEREHTNLEFARNRSLKAQDRNKCLLIMNVDGRWVVEGSHNFPTWVFPPGKLSSLKPYESQYTCDEIRDIRGREQPERIVHLGDWRNKVLTAIQT